MKKIFLIFLLVNATLLAQNSCKDFQIGYKSINWNFTPIELKTTLTNNGFVLDEEEMYKISDGRSASYYRFKLNDYDHYKTDKPFWVYVIKYVDHKMVSIEYTNHFNWNYSKSMAEKSADKIARKYNLPQENEQNLGFDVTNKVWLTDCPNYRIILKLLWDPNVVYDNYPGGEVIRYLSMWIFNVEKIKEYRSITSINWRENRKSKRKSIIDDF